MFARRTISALSPDWLTAINGVVGPRIPARKWRSSAVPSITAVRNFENGRLVDRSGSFEAGVDGAVAGVALPANPEPGMTYRQEYYADEAEDRGAVITVGEEQVQVPFGFYDRDVLMTRDLVPTEPKVQELKFYAPGVGPLLSVHTDTPGGRAELVSFTPGP